MSLRSASQMLPQTSSDTHKSWCPTFGEWKFCRFFFFLVRAISRIVEAEWKSPSLCLSAETHVGLAAGSAFPGSFQIPASISAWLHTGGKAQRAAVLGQRRQRGGWQPQLKDFNNEMLVRVSLKCPPRKTWNGSVRKVIS